jgi:hypothetical protein
MPGARTSGGEECRKSQHGSTTTRTGATERTNALFSWLISHQSAVLFSQNKPDTRNQPAVLFSHNKPTPAISHQPTEQAERGK